MQITPTTAAQTPASASAFSSLAGNIDTFLTLLTAQLRNQDPLKPLDTEKFTSQLVQFASVEQSIKTNSHLEALIALQGATDRQSALAFIGRDATIASDKAALSGGRADWTYALPQDAQALTLSVVNAQGEVVARSAGTAPAGAHAFSWDGTTLDGALAPDGVYTLQVEASGADGAKLLVDIETTARVNAAAFADGETLLETSVGTFELSKVRRIAAE
ncbi:MAG: flagellar hook assembly protein FlgD [Parvularculaceae bacterium]